MIYIHWTLFIYAFLFGVIAALFCIRKIMIYVAGHNLKWALGMMQKMHDVLEEATAKGIGGHDDKNNRSKG